MNTQFFLCESLIFIQTAIFYWFVFYFFVCILGTNYYYMADIVTQSISLSFHFGYDVF